jgi:hypothetical protein
VEAKRWRRRGGARRRQRLHRDRRDGAERRLAEALATSGRRSIDPQHRSAATVAPSGGFSLSPSASFPPMRRPRRLVEALAASGRCTIAFEILVVAVAGGAARRLVEPLAASGRRVIVSTVAAPLARAASRPTPWGPCPSAPGAGPLRSRRDA